MDAPAADPPATVAAGRAGTVAQLRSSPPRSRRSHSTPSPILVLLEPTLDYLRRQAVVALERAPASN
jgi:hypothetical protein